MDSKSIGLCPQGFESPRCRFPLPVNQPALQQRRSTTQTNNSKLSNVVPHLWAHEANGSIAFKCCTIGDSTIVATSLVFIECACAKLPRAGVQREAVNLKAGTSKLAGSDADVPASRIGNQESNICLGLEKSPRN